MNYDMTLNSERVGIDDCVRIIEDYLVLKGFVSGEEIGNKDKSPESDKASAKK